MVRAVLACCVALGCASSAPVARAPAPGDCEGSDSTSVVAHDVVLEVSLAPRSLHGHGEVTVTASRPTRNVALHAKLAWVREVTVNGAAVPFEHRAGRLCIHLPNEINGEAVTIGARWEAHTDRETPRFFADQLWAGYSTSTWVPTLESAAARATLRLTVVSPAQTTTVASGRHVATRQRPDGRVESTFEVSEPTQPFLFALATGHFAELAREVDGVKLRVLAPPGVDASAVMQATLVALRALRDLTGVDLPAHEYTQVLVHQDAAQEAVNVALLGEGVVADLVNDPTDDWLVVHELAHQWFGVSVSCLDFNDFWLNEGFATFMVGAVKEKTQGLGALEREVATWQARSAKAHAAGRDAPLSLAAPGAPRRALADADLQARGVTYFRGALVLRALRTELGDDAFWRGVQSYLRSGEKRVTSERLRAAFEAASGRDLRPFFARWVYAAAPDVGAP